MGYLYDYKNFLGDSDKIVKKYFTLKRKAREHKNLGRIGLDEYFQPVTSVIKKELKPFHNLTNEEKEPPIYNLIDLDDKEMVDKGTEVRVTAGTVVGTEVGTTERQSNSGWVGEDVKDEDTGEKKEDEEEDDEYLSPLEEETMTTEFDKKYEEIKNFFFFQELNRNYPEEKRDS